MTRLSRLARSAAELTTALIFAALVAVTAACSGGSGDTASSAAPSGNPPQGGTIEGVATPSSVAVVTATNAQ